MTFRGNNGTALRDVNKARTLVSSTPSIPSSGLAVVFSTFPRFITTSFRTFTLIRNILRGYFNINEGTPVNKSFPD